MIRIGAVSIDTSHPRTFAEHLRGDVRAGYVAVFNDGFRTGREVQNFISRYGLEKRCKSIEELADYVDMGFIHSCNWDKHVEQAIPFLERGKPVFIDKPVAGSMKDCSKLEELAAAGGVILGSSSLRYSQEVVEFAAIPEQERGKIVSIFGTVGSDNFNYAIHIVEAICALAGAGAVSARFAGRSDAGGNICETFFIRFSNGITAVYNILLGIGQPFEMVIMTTRTTYHFRIDTGKIYKSLLDRICGVTPGTRNGMAPVEDLTESVKIMLAARLSGIAGGTEVMLSDIPEDDPGYDGDAFERGYALKAAGMYE